MVETVTDQYGVSESAVSATATQSRRLMMARELSTSWNVDYTIVADKSTAESSYSIAQQLAAGDGTLVDNFVSKLNSALSALTGQSVTVSVTHTAAVLIPVVPGATTTTTTRTTTTTTITTTTTEGSPYVIIGIVAGSVFGLVLVAVCLGCCWRAEQYKYRLHQERVQKERRNIVIHEDLESASGTRHSPPQAPHRPGITGASGTRHSPPSEIRRLGSRNAQRRTTPTTSPRTTSSNMARRTASSSPGRSRSSAEYRALAI